MALSLVGYITPTSATLNMSHLTTGSMKLQGKNVAGQRTEWEASQQGHFNGLPPIRSYIGFERRRGGIIVPRHAMTYEVIDTNEDGKVVSLGGIRVSTQFEYTSSMLPTAELLASADLACVRHRVGTITSGTPDMAFYDAMAGLRNPY